MAHVYDILHDGIGIFGIPFCVPGWVDARLLIMDIQLIIVLAVGFCACLYLGRIILTNLDTTSQNSPCKKCSEKKGSRQANR